MARRRPPRGWRRAERRIPVNNAVRKLRALRYMSLKRDGRYLWAHVSQRGVPMLLVEVWGVSHSIAYFAKTRKFRVHWPFGEGYVQQEVRSFDAPGQVLEWLRRREALPDG